MGTLDSVSTVNNKQWFTKPIIILGAAVVLLFIVCIALIIVVAKSASNAVNDDTCVGDQGAERGIKIFKDVFGVTSGGQGVERFIMKNINNLEVHIIALGGCITSLKVPDRNGKLGDIVLGYDNVEGYEDPSLSVYFGALVGRYANRIAKGQFEIDGVAYQLNVNNGENHLHGGIKGWDKALWNGNVGPDHVQLKYASPDGDENYPGQIEAVVTYHLTNDNELIMNYSATTTKASPISLSGHSYFNLAGEGAGNIYDHEVQIYADKYLPVDDGLIPTGEIKDVTGTEFDLREAKTLGSVLNENVTEIYDHNFCIRGPTGKRHVARVYHPGSGRVMEVWSNQPGVQFYTGNFLDVSKGTKNNHEYKKHSGFCLETQNYPDAPNRPNFPDSIIRPGSTYHHHAWFKFTTD